MGKLSLTLWRRLVHFWDSLFSFHDVSGSGVGEPLLLRLRGRRKKKIAAPPPWRPALEGLEPRLVPSVVVNDHGPHLWANRVESVSSMWTAGGETPDDDGPYQWWAVRAVGVPDTEHYGALWTDETSWSPLYRDGSIETLTLAFATATVATGFGIFESWGIGYVTKVQLRQHDYPYTLYTVWDATIDGPDPSVPDSPPVVEEFTHFFTATAYEVDQIRITIDTNLNQYEWEYLDAVRLFTTMSLENITEPAAENDAVTVAVNGSVDIHVLDNDTGQEEDDGHPFAYLSWDTDAPEHGELTIDCNGTLNDLSDDFFVYEPDTDYSGPDHFTYTMTDIYGGVATATVAINITSNNAPTLDTISNPSAIPEGTGIQTVNLSGIGDGDSGTQTLTVTATSSNTTLLPHPTVIYTSAQATGQLTYTPVADAFGSITVTVTVHDNGGVTDNGTDTVTKSFVVVITPINDAPTLNAISAITINEDASTGVSLSNITSGSSFESQTLTVTASSSNTALVPNPSITYSSANSTGTATIAPAANAFGSATISITVQDNGGTSAGGVDTVVRSFVVTVTSVNDAPTLNTISSPGAINEDTTATQTISLTGIGAGASNESGQALTVTATSNNTGVIPNPTVTYTSADATGNLTYAAVTNGYGSATVTVTVTDDGGTANGGVNVFTRSFLVVVTAVNDAPTLDSLSPMNISEDATTRTVSLTNITAGPNESQTLTVTALSSATAIVPNPTMTYTSPNTTGQITFTPVADANGTVTITVTVNDGQGLNNTIDRTFVVAISAINDPPTINSIAGVTINEDDGTQTVTFSGVTAGPTNESGQTITVYAVSSDTQIIYNPTVSYSNPNTSGTLTITPLPNANGAVTITVTVNDGQGLNNSFVTTMDFGITVVNDLPTLDAPVDITIPEDYGTQTVKITGISEGPANESSQSLVVTATSSNTTLMNHPTVRYHEGDSTGTLVFTAPDGHVGSTTITVTVNDGQGLNNTVSRTFVITVAAYNDPPTLDPLSSLTIPMDVSPPTRTVSLTGISSGSSDESQTLVVTALSSNTPLIPNPSVTYSSANTTGRITFTPASNQHGTVTLSVTVNDGEFFHGAITRSFTVKINEAGPVAGDDGPYTVHQGDTLLTWELGLDGLLENDTDADDDPLLITHINSDDEFAFGHPYHVSNGDLTLYDDGTFAYTPDPGFTGLQTFTYTISDGGASDTGTVSISVTNTTPVAVDDYYQVLLNGSLDASPEWFGVLGNDTDADGDELVVTEVEGHELVSGTVTLALTSGASLTLYEDGTFSYAPASGATATYNDSFEYTIFDGAAFATATAHIDVVHPIAANFDWAEVDEDGSLLIDVLSNDAAATGTLFIADAGGLDPSQGSAWTEGDGIRFIPAANFFGLATFSYSMDDGYSHQSTGYVYINVTPVNDAPVLDMPSNPTVDEDEYANVLSAGVADVDAGSADVQLTFSAANGSLTISTSYGLDEEDISGNGTSELVITAPLSTINTTLAVTGGLRYRGDQDFHGTDTVTVTLDDLGNTGAGGALTDTGTFTVTVSSVNDGPVAEDDNLAANLEQTVTFWPLLNDVDADGDTLTITHLNNTSISPETSMYLGHYWATLHSNGSLTLVPDELVLDEYSFTYTVNDNHGGTDVATVTVAVGDGQWAYRVLSFSSMWGSDAYPWLAVQATGVPDTNAYGDVESTWAPEPMNGGLQTLTLSFVAPTYANGFLIRESYGNGFVTKVELLQTGNHSHATIVFDVDDSEDPDEDDSLPGSVVNLTRFFAATTVTVDAIRITIETGDEMSDEVWEEIDAVRLFGTVTGNNAPSAGDDTATVNEDASVIIHVLDNDSDDYDQNDRPFAYLSIATTTDAPAHGTVDVQLQANGDPNNLTDYYLVYTPDADWNGDDHFTYTLTDLGGLTATGEVTVSVNPVNDAPVAVDDYQVTGKNQAITFDPLDNDDDIDVGDEFTLSSYSQPGHGSVALDGDELVYTPSTSFVGHDAFSYTISDGSATATAMVSVYVYESGQWATSVAAVSSEYHGEDEDEWQAEDALNAPDTFSYGEKPTAWAPAEANDGEQFIKVEFPSPQAATGLLIRETLGYGFVSRVVLSDASDSFTYTWNGVDPSQPNNPTDLILRFSAPDFDIKYATIYIDTGTAEDGDASWEEIDAVRLITATGTFSGTEVFTSVADGPGAWTVNKYDNKSRLTHKDIHEGSGLRTTDYSYHEDPEYLETFDETDSLGHTTRTIFDENGNIVSQILDYEDGDSPGIDYIYDDRGRVLSLTDPNGNETTWVYDDEAQTSEMTDPLNHVVTTTYDDFGRTISIVDRKGRVREFTYDHNSRLVKEEWFTNISDTTADETLRFAYNTAGQLTRASNSAGTYEYTYNAAGQLTQVVEPFDVTLTFGYDDAGNRTSITDSFGGTISSTYDAGQLTTRMFTQTSKPTLRIDQEFDAFGRIAEQSRYSNSDGTAIVATSEYTYDASGRLTGLVHRDDDAAEIAEYGWTFDAEGQMASQTDGETTHNYTYDNKGQLTGDGTSTWSYAGDDNGSRTSNGGVIGDANQLVSDNDWEYTYDDEGNLIERESDDVKWTYSWDNKNQLVQVLEYDKNHGNHVDLDVKFRYDAFGNRIEKAVNGSIQRYALDGWNPAKPSPVGNENWDVLFDLSGNNNWNTLQTRYLRGDAVDELFARVDTVSDTKPYWYLNDHLGSTRVLFESALEVVADEISYDAWGNITSETYPEACGRYAWTGREFDAETSLQYNRGRYYDQAAGRWISQDPVGFKAGDSNLYRYTKNEPLNHTDASGFHEVRRGEPVKGEVNKPTSIPAKPAWQKDLGEAIENGLLFPNAITPEMLNSMSSATLHDFLAGVGKHRFDATIFTKGNLDLIKLSQTDGLIPLLAAMWGSGDTQAFSRLVAAEPLTSISIIEKEFPRALTVLRESEIAMQTMAKDIKANPHLRKEDLVALSIIGEGLEEQTNGALLAAAAWALNSPSGFVPLTAARAQQLWLSNPANAAAAIFMAPGQMPRQVGLDLEARLRKILPNDRPSGAKSYPSPARNAVLGRTLNVNPDFVTSTVFAQRNWHKANPLFNNTTVRTIPENVFGDVKIGPRVSKSTNDYQALGFIDHLANSHQNGDPPPSLVYVTNVDCIIGTSIIREANTRRVAVWQAVLLENQGATLNGQPNITISPPVLLNPQVYVPPPVKVNIVTGVPSAYVPVIPPFTVLPGGQWAKFP